MWLVVLRTLSRSPGGTMSVSGPSSSQWTRPIGKTSPCPVSVFVLPGHQHGSLYCFLSGHSSSLSRSFRRLWVVRVFQLWWSREAAPAWTAWMPTQRKHPFIGFTGHWRASHLGRAEICRYKSHREHSVLLIMIISHSHVLYNFDEWLTRAHWCWCFRMRNQMKELKLRLCRDVCLFCAGRWRRCALSCWRRTRCLSWLKTWTASLVTTS